MTTFNENQNTTAYFYYYCSIAPSARALNHVDGNNHTSDPVANACCIISSDIACNMHVQKRQATLFELFNRARASPDAQDHSSDGPSPTSTPAYAVQASAPHNTCTQPSNRDESTKRCFSARYGMPTAITLYTYNTHSTTSSKRSRSQLHLDLGQVAIGDFRLYTVAHTTHTEARGLHHVRGLWHGLHRWPTRRRCPACQVPQGRHAGPTIPRTKPSLPQKPIGRLPNHSDGLVSVWPGLTVLTNAWWWCSQRTARLSSARPGTCVRP